MEKRFPRYLSEPYQVLWFEPDDLGLVAVFIFLAICFGGIFWLFIIVGPWLYMRSKKNAPRGAFKHYLYCIGLLNFNGYPSYFEDTFIE